jgi:hypothetical protein
VEKPIAGFSSLAAASACLAVFTWWLYSHLPGRWPEVRAHAVYPFAAVAGLCALLYFARITPPVPLSLSEIGVYHEVRREGPRFELTTLRPRWKFWQRGDQDFLARPGDAVYCWVVVFSPTHFQERLSVRWLFRERDGWGEPDTIPLDIAGGRDGGWRAFTVKANYKPGRWRVEIVTSDNRELGRIDFDIIPDASAGKREQRVLLR